MDKGDNPFPTIRCVQRFWLKNRKCKGPEMDSNFGQDGLGREQREESLERRSDHTGLSSHSKDHLH